MAKDQKADAPEEVGKAVPVVESVATSAQIQRLEDRIEELERETKHLGKSLESVGDNNKFILTVLYVSYVVIIVAIGVAIVTLLIKR